MDFDANSLIVSMIVSSIGLVAFLYGKRQSRAPQMAVGVLLMVYPYFVSNIPLMACIAVALLVALWGAVRLGW